MYHVQPMQSNTYKKFIFSKTAFVLSLIALIIVARATWSVSSKARSTKANLAEAESELVELAEREKRLEEDITYLKTEQGIEAEIRDKYNVARAGENVIVLVDSEESETKEIEIEEKVGFFKRIGRIFKSDR